MTDCRNGEVRDLLPELLTGRLSPDVRRDVEAHVQACADCGAELALLRDLRATMARVPVLDAARLAAALPAYRPPARRAWVGWRAAAAVVVIVAGATSVALVQHRVGHRTDTKLASATQSAAPVISQAHPTLPAPAVHVPPPPPPPTTVAEARHVAARELALASSATSDLSDRELKVLLREIESLDALPSTDVENAAAISPVAPRVGGGGSSE